MLFYKDTRIVQFSVRLPPTMTKWALHMIIDKSKIRKYDLEKGKAA